MILQGLGSHDKIKKKNQIWELFYTYAHVFIC